jgi:biopolymer transport protein TolQ
METSIASAAAPTISPFTLFWEADIVVKLVILGLLAASVWSWGVIVSKVRRYRDVRRAADKFEDSFWSGVSLDKLFDGPEGKASHPFAIVFAAAMTEWRRSVQPGTRLDKASVKQRIATVMRVNFEREMDSMERSLNVLATVGSVTPFIGLFGTVWGIMRSFVGIAASQNATLAVVAPGIAEALFATAVGLFAAIPAVIFYNRLQAEAARFGNRMSTFCDEFSAILSRQLDEKAS